MYLNSYTIDCNTENSTTNTEWHAIAMYITLKSWKLHENYIAC